MLDHLPGDMSCPYCDRSPEECQNCGGIIHFEMLENLEGYQFTGIPFAEETSECDGCGPDYII